jgi:hypothetical protein
MILYPFIGHLNEEKLPAVTAHTARVSMTLPRDMLGNSIISKDIWPPRSSDLTRPDYHLGRSMKGAVCRGNPRTLLELKEAKQELASY